jgi:hypothetical protein
VIVNPFPYGDIRVSCILQAAVIQADRPPRLWWERDTATHNTTLSEWDDALGVGVSRSPAQHMHMTNAVGVVLAATNPPKRQRRENCPLAFRLLARVARYVIDRLRTS